MASSMQLVSAFTQLAKQLLMNQWAYSDWLIRFGKTATTWSAYNLYHYVASCLNAGRSYDRGGASRVVH